MHQLPNAAVDARAVTPKMEAVKKTTLTATAVPMGTAHPFKSDILTTSKTCSCGAKSGTCYKCKECNSASDCPSYNPVCSDGICGCRSGYYLNGGGYCCPNDVPNGTVSDACYY